MQDAMSKCELTTADVKLIIPHQVNQRIIDSAMEKLGLPPEKVFVNIQKYGNTSAASIPIALDECVRAGKLERGDLLAITAFGSGFMWGSALIRW
jgi:3-oxoacyl-[acyl-carrier-protein] synthase-3